MIQDVHAIAAGLAAMDDASALCRQVQERVGAGDAAFAADLGIALWQRYGDEPGAPWQYHSVLDHVLRLLTLTPGTVGEAVLMLAVIGTPRRCRQAAALLASGHSVGGLADALGRAAPPELRACLRHELVVRRFPVDVDWSGEPWWPDHPLSWLPARLTRLEDTSATRIRDFLGEGGPVPAARDTTTAGAAAGIGAAVRNWAAESNGRWEARTYELDGALRPGAVGPVLRGTGVAALQVEAGPCPPENAWGQLFKAASTGGAYSRGELGAYGRLAAWRSVAALAGAPADATAARVEAAARACAWYSFGGDWFRNEGWDLGLAAVSRDGRRLAVLAATDTD